MDESKFLKILDNYKQSVDDVRSRLRDAGMSEHQIVLHTINFPNFNAMIPEDTVKFYRDVKKLLIIHLDSLGFSSREISSRLGGCGRSFVVEILEEYRKSQTVPVANVEEVSK